MNTEIFSIEANNIWKKSASDNQLRNLKVDVDLYKKLLTFFQVGDFFYWVFSMANTELELVSSDVKNVLGYEPSGFDINFLLEIIHPDDRPWFLNFENKLRDFFESLPVDKLMKYKARYDIRLRRKDGSYIRMLNQAMVVEHTEQGQVLRTFGIFTDISHLKSEGRPALSCIGIDGEPSYIDIDVKEVFNVSKHNLSKREKEILLLIIDGKLSKEISGILHISKQTVDTHRNNMLAKNHLKNTSELIAKAIKQGWI